MVKYGVLGEGRDGEFHSVVDYVIYQDSTRQLNRHIIWPKRVIYV